MFLPQRVEVGQHLVLGTVAGDNELEIRFESAARIARARFERGGLRWENVREQTRVWVRKAQYHWGW